MARCADATDASDPTDLDQLTPEQRLDELCALFAAGIRLLAEAAHISIATPHTSPAQIPLESSQIGLDQSPELSVHGPCPVNTQEKSGKGVGA
jgi:hypothetical protein